MMKLESSTEILKRAFVLFIKPQSLKVYICAGVLPQLGFSSFLLLVIRLFLTNTYVIDAISESSVLLLIVLVSILLVLSIFIGTWYYIFMVHIHHAIVTGQHVEYRILINVSRNLIARVIKTNFMRICLLLIGYVLFIIPGILFTLWYYFSALIAAIENPSDSPLQVSKRIVRMNFWPITGRIIIFGLLYSIPYLIFNKVSPLLSNIWLLSNPYWGLVQMIFYINIKAYNAKNTEVLG